ncbi:hypothetical protein K3495_g13841 [Podosphaera aphanis]|nr:hypothetical protein K3495_g13841 [Podosphaera aphanis]
MENPWGEQMNETSCIPAPTQQLESRHDIAWRALAEVMGNYPALGEIFDGVGFEKRVDLSSLADAPVEFRTIFHEMFSLINQHSSANRQALQEIRAALNGREKSIQKLRSSIERKNTEVTSLQRQLTSISNANQAPQPQAAAPQGTTSQGQPLQTGIYLDRPPSLNPFTGDQKNVVKRHNEYTAWKFKLITKWNLNHTVFETEFKKICDIINWLDGDAYTRLQSKIGVFFSANENPTNWPWASSGDFFQELDRKYLTVDIKAIAVGNLNELKMVGKFKVFPSFISEFEKFADQADLSSTMRVYHLRRKVSEPLRIAVKNHIPAPPEDSITEWIELYYQFWKNQEADRQITGSSGNLGVGDRPLIQGHNGNIQTGDPMDLDRMQLNRVSVTPAEWQYRRDHGLCNRCGGDGHYSRNCSSELAKRSKRRFDTADRDLQSGSRSGPQGIQGSYRGNYNSGHDLRPQQDSQLDNETLKIDVFTDSSLRIIKTIHLKLAS